MRLRLYSFIRALKRLLANIIKPDLVHNMRQRCLITGPQDDVTELLDNLSKGLAPQLVQSVPAQI